MVITPNVPLITLRKTTRWRMTGLNVLRSLKVLPLVIPRNRIRDLDNYNKALFDALTHAGVWEDDSQVKRMLVEWGPVIPEGKVEITISKYEKTAGAAA
ncbi:RusA family crossover junction endodeoxyribonuclease [Escherichia coli]